MTFMPESEGHVTHGLRRSKLYNQWVGIKTRCLNKNNFKYKSYGGRGITICDEWRDDFKAFYDYMTALPNYGEPEFESIDRIDNNGNYEPGNVRWATRFMQANNTRRCIYITYNGETHTCEEWTRILGYGKNTINARKAKGWTDEECLFGKKGKEMKVRYITFNGETKTTREWEKIYGWSRGTVRGRAVMGWSPEECVLGRGGDKREPIGTSEAGS